MPQTNFWKTYPVFFRSFNFRAMISRKFIGSKISGYELDRFLENSSIFGWVFQISVCGTPRNSLNIIFRRNALFSMSFPEIDLCHAQKFLNWRLDGFSRNRSSSYPGNLAIRVYACRNFTLILFLRKKTVVWKKYLWRQKYDSVLLCHWKSSCKGVFLCIFMGFKEFRWVLSRVWDPSGFTLRK